MSGVKLAIYFAIGFCVFMTICVHSDRRLMSRFTYTSEEQYRVVRSITNNTATNVIDSLLAGFIVMIASIGIPYL